MHHSKLIFLVCTIIMILSCNKNNQIELAEKQYSKQEIDSITYSVIRYLGKLAGKANHGTKFNEDFDEYYTELAKRHDLVYFVKSKKDDHFYFLFTRIAPSLHLKKVAIGGKLKVEAGKLAYYEEAFRTWKMLVPELEEKMNLIFKDYFEGKDLTKYYTKNSNGIEYIEFPDDDNHFNTEKRIWESSIDDYMEPYYQMKKGVDTVKAK